MIFVYILCAVAAAFVPICFAVSWKRENKKKTVRALFAASLSGVALVLIDTAVYVIKSKTLSGDVSDWADDFFFGSLGYVLVPAVFVTAVLSLSALFLGRMKYVRLALSFVYPIFICLFCHILSLPAAGGAFPVDSYITALAPGFMLFACFPAALEMKKSDSMKNSR